MNIEEQTILAKAAYEKAKEMQATAKKVLEDLKGTQEPVKTAYLQAKKAYDGLTPALNLAKAQVQKADAEVTITKAAYGALAPKEVAAEKKEGASNKALLEAVKAVLNGKAEGMTNGDIYDAVTASGVTLAGEKARENFSSYLHRWGSAGALVDMGKGKWGYNVPVPSTTEVPSFLGGTPVEPSDTPVPSFLGGTPASKPLTEDFPGYEPLAVAGFSTFESLAGKTAEDLQQIPGIGAKTATKILEALAA